MTEFETLFRDKQPFVYRYLVKLTQDAALAEELTQETFFRAYMNYSGLRDKDKASVWLCQIAKNAYFTWYNEQKKRGALPENADGEVMLSVFGGFSLKDVSAIFGKSESWARVTFYRARQKLMERMNQHGL